MAKNSVLFHDYIYGCIIDFDTFAEICNLDDKFFLL